MKIIHLNILIHQNMYLDNFEEECTFSDLLKGIIGNYIDIIID